jgi:hypothetical protein
MDKGHGHKGMIDGCINPKQSPRKWFPTQGCTDVDLVPLSKLDQIDNLDHCDSVKIAYNGHARELHLTDFLNKTKGLVSNDYNGSLVAKSDACGLSSDMTSLEHNKALMKTLLKKFSGVTVEANQTECTSEHATPFKTHFSLNDDGTYDSVRSYQPCATAGNACAAVDDVFTWKGQVRHYRNYWQCRDKSNKVVKQYCCGTISTEESTVYGKWNPPGIKACLPTKIPTFSRI